MKPGLLSLFCCPGAASSPGTSMHVNASPAGRTLGRLACDPCLSFSGISALFDIAMPRYGQLSHVLGSNPCVSLVDTADAE